MLFDPAAERTKRLLVEALAPTAARQTRVLDDGLGHGHAAPDLLLQALDGPQALLEVLQDGLRLATKHIAGAGEERLVERVRGAGRRCVDLRRRRAIEQGERARDRAAKCQDDHDDATHEGISA